MFFKFFKLTASPWTLDSSNKCSTARFQNFWVFTPENLCRCAIAQPFFWPGIQSAHGSAWLPFWTPWRSRSLSGRFASLNHLHSRWSLAGGTDKGHKNTKIATAFCQTSDGPKTQSRCPMSASVPRLRGKRMKHFIPRESWQDSSHSVPLSSVFAGCRL